MEPQFTKKTFIRATLKSGQALVRPLESFGGKAYIEMTLKNEGHEVKKLETIENRWWVRLGTRGMLEATPWEGPFPTKGQARKHIERKSR